MSDLRIAGGHEAVWPRIGAREGEQVLWDHRYLRAEELWPAGRRRCLEEGRPQKQRRRRIARLEVRAPGYQDGYEQNACHTSRTLIYHGLGALHHFEVVVCTQIPAGEKPKRSSGANT